VNVEITEEQPGGDALEKDQAKKNHPESN